MRIDKKRVLKQPVKSEVISVKVSKDLKNWLKKENISPSKLFLMACQSIGYKE